MERYGIDVSSRLQVAVFGERSIQRIEPLIHPIDGLPLLAPGFIDLQINGYAGVDYNNPAAAHEEIARSLRALFATGVTRLLPTVITGPPEAMTGALRNLARAREVFPEGRAIAGFHVEGPHISLDDGPRAAHPKEWVRPPDLAEFDRWQDAAEGNVKLVTLSPEWPGAPRYIETITGRGVAVAIGHTGATAGQIADAVRAGATLSTHLGNAGHSTLPRWNYIWDQLAEDRLAAGFIVDGLHLPASFLKVAIRAKGTERTILVTDAVMPAGCAPGRYRLGTVEVELHAPGDRVTLAGRERLAGSVLRMDRAIGNVVSLAGLSLVEAIAAATRNPARVGRIGGRQKGLAEGDRADLVELEWNAAANTLKVLRTFLDGEQVYAA